MSNTKRIINNQAKVIQHLLKDDGIFPNSIYPALVYKNVLQLPAGSHPKVIEDIFEANKDQIKDPNLIHPGQKLKIPAV